MDKLLQRYHKLLFIAPHICIATTPTSLWYSGISYILISFAVVISQFWMMDRLQCPEETTVILKVNSISHGHMPKAALEPDRDLTTESPSKILFFIELLFFWGGGGGVGVVLISAMVCLLNPRLTSLNHIISIMEAFTLVILFLWLCHRLIGAAFEKCGLVGCQLICISLLNIFHNSLLL